MGLSDRQKLFLRLFLTSTTLLCYEVLLTRIISAMFVKYFSLLAISMAMMGLGIAGVLVQVYLQRQSAERQSFFLGLSAIALPLSLVFLPLFVSFVRVPSYFLQLGDVWRLFAFISVCVLPFFWGGVVLSLTYHQWAQWVDKLYFSDLLGAAAGCTLAFVILNQTDGLSAILFSALLGTGPLITLAADKTRRRKITALTVSSLIGLFFLANHWGQFARLPHPGGPKQVNEWEKWSEFGLTTISKKSHFTGIGHSTNSHPLSTKLFKSIRHDYNSLTLAVDASISGEDLERFNNQLPNFALRFKQKPRVLVLGSGGGKEVFAALASDAQEVTAVEFNRIIVHDIMQDYLKDFSGKIYQKTYVQVIVDEARNFLNRTNDRFDVILPVTGTTPRLLAASCYVFSTEYLQTKEAYRSYLEHLTPRGVFSFKTSFPAAKLDNTIHPFYRMLTTIKEVLKESGRSPLEHLLIVGGPSHPSFGSGDYALTILFSPAAFTRQEVKRAQELARKMGFGVVFSPYGYQEGLLSRFLLANNLEPFSRSSNVDIHPVVDDRPYYYHHLKADAAWELDELPDYFRLLLIISLIFLGYTLLLIILPLLISPRHSLSKETGGGLGANLLALLYFGCLGLGFIGLELTLMQKVNFLLGIPSWGFLVTVLSFTFFMGLGALAGGRVKTDKIKKYIWWLFFLLLLILFAYATLFPWLLKTVAAWQNLAKMGLVFVLLAPTGFLLGMPFVWGIRCLGKERQGAVAWMWAINSTTSTMGAVGITLLWLRWGHTNTALACLGLYLLAAGLLSLFPRQKLPGKTAEPAN